MRNKLLNDLVTAMKNQDKETLSVLRMAKGAIQLEEINLKHELTDDEFIGVIGKQIKTRKESVVEFEKAGRDVRAEATAKIAITTTNKERHHVQTNEKIQAADFKRRMH